MTLHEAVVRYSATNKSCSNATVLSKDLRGDHAGGRIVYVNAELHTLAKDASPGYTYSDAGSEAYCRYAIGRGKPDFNTDEVAAR